MRGPFNIHEFFTHYVITYLFIYPPSRFPEKSNKTGYDTSVFESKKKKKVLISTWPVWSLTLSLIHWISYSAPLSRGLHSSWSCVLRIKTRVWKKKRRRSQQDKQCRYPAEVRHLWPTGEPPKEKEWGTEKTFYSAIKGVKRLERTHWQYTPWSFDSFCVKPGGSWRPI